jgi:hypothetical protein
LSTDPKYAAKLALLLEIVKDQAPQNGVITAETTLGELEFDSLDMVETGIMIEDRTGLVFDWPNGVFREDHEAWDSTTLATLATHLPELPSNAG